MADDGLWILRMMTEQYHRDTEGRPLREGRTPPQHLKTGEIDYKQCPFPGKRYKHPNPMNQSAIVQVSAHWDALADCLSFIREAYTEQNGAWGPDIWDLWRLSQIASALPWYYILKGETSPAYAAALSKVMLGVGMWSQRMFVKQFEDRWVPPPKFTSKEIIDLAEQNDVLIAPTEVCSASEKMMYRYFDVLTGDPVPHQSPLVEVKDSVMLFGAHYTAFKHVIYLYWLARRFLIADIAAARGTSELIEQLMIPESEPPDYYIAEPGNLASVPPPMRAAWFKMLASLLRPFAPDRSDQPVKDLADEVSAVMAVENADPIARAKIAFERLDRIHNDTILIVERHFRRAHGVADFTGTLDAPLRDRLVLTPARALFDSL